MSIEGRHILTTRNIDSNDDFDSILISNGAVVEYFSTIKITPVEDNTKLESIINEINSYEGIFFTSANGVKYFLKNLKKAGTHFNGKIYSVGVKTDQQLKKYGYESSFIPETFSSNDLINQIDKEEIRGKKFLYPRGNLSTGKLIGDLNNYSKVEEIIIYQTLCPNYEEEYIDWIKNVLLSNGVDCITYFSPSSIKNFYGILGKISLDNIDVAVIGNTTLDKAKEYGLNVGIIPEKSTSEFLARAIVDYYNGKN